MAAKGIALAAAAGRRKGLTPDANPLYIGSAQPCSSYFLLTQFLLPALHYSRPSNMMFIFDFREEHQGV